MKTGTKKGIKSSSLLTKLMSSKDVEYDIGTVHIKESFANALEVIKSNDVKLFEMVIKEAFESINLVALADEYERKIKRQKSLNDSSKNSATDSSNTTVDTGSYTGIENSIR